MRTRLALAAVAALLLSACEEKRPSRIAPPQAAMAPAITVPAPPPPAPKPDPVVDLLSRSNREFDSGRAQYSAGLFEEAKASVERSLSVVTQAPVAISSDPRLRQQFDKINAFLAQMQPPAPAQEPESEAEAQEEHEPEQKAEPAPIDEANEAVAPSEPAVKAKAEAELRQTRSDIPLVINDYVAGYINFFTNTARGRNTLISGWQRAGRYRDMIFRVLKEEGVPQDLFYLAQAESGFKPLAVSRVGARGMWQFMHYTAPLYGLTKNWWLDDRQDPEKSTRAAARHLKDLHTQFGDWWLAMAAYNSGAGNVQRAVQRTGYADFWELYKRNVLPGETKNYVPIIIAMTIIAKNPAQYGLDAFSIEPPLQPDVVTTDYAVDLRLVAEAVDAPLEEIAELNPALIRRVTPRALSYDLKLPHGARQVYLDAIATIPEDKRVHWRFHRVAPGETLYSIAKKYRVTESSVLEVNGLDRADIQADAKLIIPATSRVKLSGKGGTYAKNAVRYRVRKGDTISSVAADFGVPEERLRRWNGLKGNNLRAGRRLVIYPPVSAEDSGSTTSSKKKTSRTSTSSKKAAAKASSSPRASR